MDGFSYFNIFETKGVEYLVIIAFLVLLIPFWIALNKQTRIVKQIHDTIGILSAKILKIPQGLFYFRNHTWMYMEKTGTAKIGLDDLLLHLTGKVKFNLFKSPGEQVRKGDLLTEINQDGKILQIFSPVSGVITDANSILNESNGLLNEDPYGKGWVYQIKPSKWISETNSCYFAEDASDWSARELERFKEFLVRTTRNYSPETAMIIMQDGGEISDHSLSGLPDGIWKDFQKEFLTPDNL